MAEYAAAAITAITATAAIVSSSSAYRNQAYRRYNAIENPAWQRRPPFTSMSLRRANAYYGQPLYYPGLHEHVHHAECPASQCHYRAFLMDSIQRYNETRRALRETYLWNLRELAYVHASQPRKPAIDKTAEADRLYAYYVSRVRDVFEEHRCDHRRLFGQDYLCWAQPEREDHVRLVLRDRARSQIASRVKSSSSGTGENSEVESANSTTLVSQEEPQKESENADEALRDEEKKTIKSMGEEEDRLS
ncbi:hypothetical protein F5Y11DRAFT_352101 [Daldinia sp. FL1419]|nr:hypothetical protein F5Y11DRAFT_352101 [Daldinia sp. FL1419]